MPQPRVEVKSEGRGERTGIPVERLSAGSPNIDPGLDGFTIALLADLHAGIRLGGTPAVAALVEDVMCLQPDAICLLGDMVHRAHNAEKHLAPLAQLDAPHGVYAVLGNHEHGVVWYSSFVGTTPSLSVPQWREVYDELGMELLVNESRALQHNGDRMWLVGVDDAYSGEDDLSAALAQTDDTDFRLVITHFPDLVDDRAAGHADLICAGHTHGSQVVLPWIGPLYTSCRKPRARARGLVRENGTLMYVTRGVGEGIPLRVRCPREITLLSLHHAEI